MSQIDTKLSKISVISFGMGEFARAMIQTLLSTFMLFYLVNYAGIKATPIGIIILVARIWDAINDPIMGYIVDNTNSKLGKARPYVLYCCGPAVLLTFMLFAVPNGLSNTAKIAWVAVSYIGGGTLLTAVDVPYNTLMVRITDNPLERMSLARAKSILSIVGVSLPIFVINTVTVGADNPRLAYIKTVGAICIFILFSYLSVFFGTKEKIKTKEKNKLNIREGILVLRRNSNWIKLILIIFLYSVHYSMTSGVLLFYLSSYFKRPELLTPIMLIVLLTTVFASAFAKPLTKKYGKKNVLVGGLSLAFLGMFIRIVTGDPNIIVFTVCLLMYYIGCCLCLVCVYPMVADTIDYGEVKTGTRVESLAFAGLTFSSKAGIGFSTAILAVMIDNAGYLDGVIEQTPKVIKTLFATGVIIPAIVLIIMTIIGLLYNLDKLMLKYQDNGNKK